MLIQQVMPTVYAMQQWDFSNSLIIAFGYQTKSSTSEITFNFPISFLNTVNCVATSYGASAQPDWNASISTLTLTKMVYRPNFGQAKGAWYIAIGFQ